MLVSESLKGKPDTKTIFYAVSSMANIEMPGKSAFHINLLVSVCVYT